MRCLTLGGWDYNIQEEHPSGIRSRWVVCSFPHWKRLESQASENHQIHKVKDVLVGFRIFLTGGLLCFWLLFPLASCQKLLTWLDWWIWNPTFHPRCPSSPSNVFWFTLIEGTRAPDSFMAMHWPCLRSIMVWLPILWCTGCLFLTFVRICHCRRTDSRNPRLIKPERCACCGWRRSVQNLSMFLLAVGLIWWNVEGLENTHPDVLCIWVARHVSLFCTDLCDIHSYEGFHKWRYPKMNDL